MVSRVAFDSDRNGERGVYIANVDGTDAHRVTGAGFAALPSWSPDGRTLAFVRGEPERPRVWNLWLLDLATGATSRITSFRYGQTWSASWFPDGQRICYSHEEQLFIHDLNTGAMREFASPIPRRLVRTPAVAPDGRHVIFQVRGSGAWLLDCSVRRDAFRSDRSHGRRVRLGARWTARRLPQRARWRVGNLADGDERRSINFRPTMIPEMWKRAAVRRRARDDHRSTTTFEEIWRRERDSPSPPPSTMFSADHVRACEQYFVNASQTALPPLSQLEGPAFDSLAFLTPPEFVCVDERSV